MSDPPDERDLREAINPVTHVRPDIGAFTCYHSQGVWLDKRYRTVVCKACSKPIDAFDALDRLAHDWDWERTYSTRKQLQKEAEALHEQVARLKTERVRERKKGFVSAELVRSEFQLVIRRLRAAKDSSLAAHYIEDTLRRILESG